MPKKTEIGNLALAGYNELFASTTPTATEPNNIIRPDFIGECVVEIPLAELSPPDFHPFHVNDDEAMERLAANIKQYGVREPGLARPRRDENGEIISGYELLAGNRRKRGCEIAERPTLPVIIRDMSDDEAIITMVDSNLEQRETLLYSEKAWAYKMKMDALNHSGIKGDKHSYEIMVEQTGESKNQIFRLIRLTDLIIGLLDMVDTKKIAFNPAVELSYLNQVEQTAIISAMGKYGVKPSHSQSVRLKKLKQAGELTIDMIDEILSETQKPTQEDVEDKTVERYRHFFPKSYTAKQILDVINTLLTDWQASEKVSA